MGTKRQQGPMVKKLIIRLMSNQAIPKGGGLSDGIKFLQDKEKILKVVRQSTIDCFAAIDAVKSARDNPFGNSDEKIAEAILQEIEKKNKGE